MLASFEGAFMSFPARFHCLHSVVETFGVKLFVLANSTEFTKLKT